MGSTALAASDYWGYLVESDKRPSPVFEQLLLGIANYIVGTFPRRHTRVIPVDNLPDRIDT